MKTLLATIVAGIAAAVCVPGLAQSDTASPGLPSSRITHTYEGEVVTVHPKEMVIAVSKGGEDDTIAYQYSKHTLFVDTDGNPIDVKMLTPGSPVAVQYTMDGDIRHVERIIAAPQSGTGGTTTSP